MPADVLHKVDESKKFWLKTPLTDKWEGAKLESVVKEVDGLVSKWKRGPVSPFAPDVDAAVLDTVKTLEQAGMLWFNNGILAPDDEPSNWPFHVKEFERWAVVAKAERVGLAQDQAAGYVCGAGEAHEFCIRAARQSIRLAAPTAAVTVVAGASAHPGVESAAEMLGVAFARVRCGQLGDMSLPHLDAVLDAIRGRGVIAVATWRNTHGGGFDDLGAIAQRLAVHSQRTGLPALLHLDAARCFDQVTTLGAAERRRLRLPRVVLGVGGLAGSSAGGAAVEVATVAAGGATLSGMGSELVVALKPRQLGARHDRFIECVAGNDGTVSGSRDALAGALVALHEARFGAVGWRRLYQQCRLIRDAITTQLAAARVPVHVHGRRALDMVIPAGPWLAAGLVFDKWGARRLADGSAMLAVQPAATWASASRLLRDFGTDLDDSQLLQRRRPWISASAFAVPAATVERIQQTTAAWRSLSATSCGYPGNHSTLSVIGPLVGHAMAAPFVPEAQAWTERRASELLEGTCAALGLAGRAAAVAAFTSGSTSSNRIGLLTALRLFPHATVYASAAAHYSIAKIAADHDRLRHTAVVRVPADALGRIQPSLLAQAVAADKRGADAAGRPFAVVLLASAGTTFSGATDHMVALHTAVARLGCRLDYIHLDGALDLGASMARYTIGAPNSGPLDPASGRLVVQGVSVSHHKFPGLSVAGQVVCWAPPAAAAAAAATTAATTATTATTATATATTAAATTAATAATAAAPATATAPADSRLLLAHHGCVNRRAVFELWLYRRLVSQADSDALYQHCVAHAGRLRSQLQEAGIAILFNPQSLITLVQRQPPWLIDRFNLSPQDDWVHFITMPHVSSAVIDEFVHAVVSHHAAVKRALAHVCRHMMHLCKVNVSLVPLNAIAVQESLLASVATALYSKQVGLDTLRAEWTSSALCFAVLDPASTLMAAFLCRVSSQQVVESCALVLRDTLRIDDVDTLANVFIGSLFSHKIISTQKLSSHDIVHVSLVNTDA